MSSATSTSGSSPLCSASDRMAAPESAVVAACQHAEQPLDDLLEVGLALAQVLVLHLVELARQHLELGRQRPLGVVVALADPLLGRAGQRVVVQQHQVHVEQRGQLRRRLGRQVALHRRRARRATASRATPQALDLGLDVGGGDVVVGDVEPARRDQHGAADRDAARNGQAEELEAHGIDASSEGAMGHSEHDARQPASKRSVATSPAPAGAMRGDATPDADADRRRDPSLPGATDLRRTCRRSAPAAPPSPPLRRRPRSRSRSRCRGRPPASSRP